MTDKLRKIFTLLFILAYSLSITAQDKSTDSLKLALHNAKHDTTRCDILEQLIDLEKNNEPWLAYNITLLTISEKNIATTNQILKKIYLRCLADALYNIAILDQQKGDVTEALNKNLRALKIYEGLNRKNDMAPTLNSIGSIYSERGNIEKALDYYTKALKISEEEGNQKEVGYYLNNIGYLYDNQGYIAKALEYYYKALKCNEQLHDSISIAPILINIGMIYKNQGDIPKALETFKKALNIQEKIKDKKGMGMALNNIGLIYSVQGDINKALTYNLKALKLREEIKDKKGIASSLGNIGAIYKNKGEMQKSLDYLYKSLKLREEINDKRGITLCLNNIANVMVVMGQTDKAFILAKKSYKVSTEINYPDLIEKSALTLKNIYEKLNRHKQALEMYELYIQMHDSINNTETKKASIKKQFQYQYEKKAAADSVKNVEEQKIKNAQLTAQKAQLKQEKTQRLALYGGLVFMIAFLGFVFNRFRVTQKQKAIIEEQKLLVDDAFKHLEEKNKEVMDSIHYARRIQRALLTPEKYINKELNKLIKP